MIAFLDTQTQAVIAVSQKVLFSFFALNPRFRRCDEAGRADFLIVRHPGERAVSLFYDKCRKAVTPDFPCFQNCQQILCQTAGFEVREQLLTLAFDDFCALLPRVALKESHFWPQTYVVDLSQVGQIIAVEHGLESLGQTLQLDFSTKVNPTPHPPWSDLKGERNTARLLQAYGEDCQRLKYEL